jgi:glutamate-ammonia-ligase adenylyltransferase
MTSDAFTQAPAALPAPFDRARAARTFDALAELNFAVPAGSDRLLEAVFGNSPFLARMAVREHAFLGELLARGPGRAFETIEKAAASAHEGADIATAMTILRRAKRQASLAVALADISGAWDLAAVTGALSRLADASLGSALRFLLREAARNAGLPDADPVRLEAETGLVVLAMGKFGAFELNYSSDIDLVVFYDAERFPFRKKGDARGAAVDIVKGLVKLLGETTQDGYVFRVDLRLRPDAGATQVAISTDAAEAYYEEMGQNWERAAMIKARPAAGDPHAAAEFLRNIEPFIWRRHLDYAAIEDIHSIKRQIHAYGGHGPIAVAGHNVKLGRGGIREIEFFAQTQQLILGGRDVSLRLRGTLAALEALRARGLVSDMAAADLGEAYLFLRGIEHRLQMIEDEQTHTLPKSHDGLAHIACFAGFADTDAFGAALLQRLELVQSHYARLFERAPPLGMAGGSLVFTGVEDDPETIETLQGMGFRDPSHVAGAIRGWHHGRIRATRSARAREILTKLMPALLDALAATADPDAAFVQFDLFLSRLPSGVQLFSLFLANPEFLKLVATIAGSAPRLADYLARSPGVLDALLDAGFLHELPTRARLDRLLGEQLAPSTSYEAGLDAARRFAKEQIFRVGLQLIEGTALAEDAGPAFTDIAETVIGGLLAAAEEELASSAGRIPGGAFAVIAMGKLGGREMTARSDLDLIFVYDAPAGVEASDGPKPQAVTHYYARLAQRLIAALTALTAEGNLYEVDMRLRPSGNKGPVAVSLESFIRYQAQDAWTWERLALTRARAVAGPAALCGEIAAVIRQALTRESDAAKLVRDAREMRDRLAAQFPARQVWDLKFAPGGLVDIEFVAQALQLRHAHRTPGILDTNTISALERLARAGLLDAAEAEPLLMAARLQRALTQMLRIAVETTLDPHSATVGLKSLLTRAGAAADFTALESELTRAQKHARLVFERILPSAPS